MCGETLGGAVTGTTGNASIRRRKATNGTEATLRHFRGWGLDRQVIGAVWIQGLLLLQQYREGFAESLFKIFRASGPPLPILVPAAIKGLLKLGGLLAHDQVGVWVVVEIVLLQGLQCLSGPSTPGTLVQDAAR